MSIVTRDIASGLQQSIGYTKTPMNLHDNDIAFMSFVGWVNSNSKEATAIRADFIQQHDATGKTTKQTAADFMDWLIVNHWGEEPKVAHIGRATPTTEGA